MSKCLKCIHWRACFGGKEWDAKIASPCEYFAIETFEVKHSQWKPYYEEVEIYNTGGFTERKQTGWICGKCKSKKSFTPYYTNYCSNCGAKMNKEAEHEAD